MAKNIAISTWNIHGLSHKTLGDKTKNKDFLNNINNIDLVFLTETWSDTIVNVPGFRAFVSDIATPNTNRGCRLSGGITLLMKTKLEKHVSIVKQSKNFLWCKVSREILNTELDLFLCGIYIPPEKSVYFEDDIFDKLENDIPFFKSKGNVIILGDFNARTSNLPDYVSIEGNKFINYTNDDCLQTKKRQNFDNSINNHGKNRHTMCACVRSGRLHRNTHNVTIFNLQSEIVNP